jgi:hypothetical protein
VLQRFVVQRRNILSDRINLAVKYISCGHYRKPHPMGITISKLRQGVNAGARSRAHTVKVGERIAQLIWIMAGPAIIA